MPINYPNLIAAIDAEIARFQQVRNLLAGIEDRNGAKAATRREGRRHLSAEARARISAAQKKRWATQKRRQGDNLRGLEDVANS